MKKSLFGILMLSVGVLGLGIETNNSMEVKASEVDGNISTKISDVTATKTDEFLDSESIEPIEKDIQIEDSLESTNKNSDESNLTIQSPTEETVQIGEPSESMTKVPDVPDVPDSKTDDLEQNNDNNVKNEIIRINPSKSDLPNSNDPAEDGKLLVPYTDHGNSAVYELDENNQPIVDENSETGYKMKDSQEVYRHDPELFKTSGAYTGEIYGLGGQLENEEQTPKVKMLLRLIREAKYFMEYRNYGYENLEELNSYIDKFHDIYRTLDSYNDDGTPIIKKASHSSSSTKTSDVLDMNVVTIRRARIFKLDGTIITNRGLENNTVWHVDKSAIVNGEKMYRIFENEWVSVRDIK